MAGREEDGRDSGTEENEDATPWSQVLRQSAPALVLFLLFGFLFFPAAGVDDAHITYWPAYTLAHSFEIVNYNGDAIEQSSSLLHRPSLPRSLQNHWI